MDDFTDTRSWALLIADAGAQMAPLEEMALIAGWRLQRTDAWRNGPGDPHAAIIPALILCDIRSGSETAAREIGRAAQYACDHGLGFIIWTDRARLDEAAFLAPEQADILVDPDAADLVFALTRAQPRRRGRLRQADDDSRELMRLSDELVEMARRVAALTDGGSGGGQVRSDPLAYRGPPGGATQPLDQPPASPIDPRAIRDMIRLRRLREEWFDADLFADPAWDMLLDLMASRLEDRPVSVSSLCIASAVPPTTALRWIKLMTDRGLLVRRADTADARRIFIALSDDAAARLHSLLSAMIGQDVPAV